MSLIETTSQEQTISIAKKLAATLHGGDIILLHGDLGSGKTTFVKGLAEAFGIKENITSPTFTLMNIYKIESKKYKVKSLVHVDTYRLKDEDELLEIGIEDYIGDKNTVTIIEWPEKIESLLQNKKVKNVRFEHMSENERRIVIDD